MTEATVMAAVIDDRKAFEAVKNYLEPDELSPQAQFWLPHIKTWYSLDSRALKVDREALLKRAKPQVPPKHSETLLGWFKDLPTEISPTNVAFDLLTEKQRVLGNKLCAAIQHDGAGDSTRALAAEYQELVTVADLGGAQDQMQILDLDQSLHDVSRENLIPLSPPSLNRKVNGGAQRGDHIIIFGRTESGKTLFAVNMIAGWVRQGYKVDYYGNEEHPGKTVARVVCSLANCTREQYEAETPRAIGLAKDRGLDLLTPIRATPGTIRAVERRTKDSRPDVIVLDQIRNMYHPGFSDMVHKLEQLGIGFRTLLSRYQALGVSITQARDTEGQVWLEETHIDNSRTGLPGTADLIIGIGKDQAMDLQDQRAISLAKNKLNDLPDGRQGFTVRIDRSRSRVK